MGIHDGHRQRLREQFERHGLEVMDDYKVLELLLFYAQPRRDTNELAHILLDNFGSLDNVLNASVGLLETVDGVGHGTAVYLSLIGAVYRRKGAVPINKKEKIASSRDAIKYLQPLFTDAVNEKFYMLMLDNRNRVIDCRLCGEGVLDTVNLDIRWITQQLICTRTCKVILAHNHPVGLPTASRDDNNTTTYLHNRFGELGISVVDHLIFSDGRCYSMNEESFI